MCSARRASSSWSSSGCGEPCSQAAVPLLVGWLLQVQVQSGTACASWPPRSSLPAWPPSHLPCLSTCFLCRGGQVIDRLHELGLQYSEQQAAQVFVQVAHAVAHLHEYGILHR